MYDVFFLQSANPEALRFIYLLEAEIFRSFEVVFSGLRTMLFYFWYFQQGLAYLIYLSLCLSIHPSMIISLSINVLSIYFHVWFYKHCRFEASLKVRREFRGEGDKQKPFFSTLHCVSIYSLLNTSFYIRSFLAPISGFKFLKLIFFLCTERGK